MRCILIIIFAVSFCHAQMGNFSNQDGFVFPGEADRPEKYPLRPTNQFRTTTERSNAQEVTPTFPSNPVNPVTPENYDTCFNNCLTTSEYNPVCGTDNVRYNNPGRLNCAVNCGKDVQIRKYGQCGDTARG